MYPLEYLLVAIFLTIFLLALARSGATGASGDEEDDEDEDEDERCGRWKSFVLHLSPLHVAHEGEGDDGDEGDGGGEAPAVLEETPGRFQLFLSRRRPSDRRVVLEERSGKPRIRVSREGIFARNRFRVDVDNRAFLRLLPAPRGKKVPVLQFTKDGDRCEIQGNPARREYELRKSGRLAAIVSQQGAADESHENHDCVVETLRTERPLPLLAVAVALEVALGPPKAETI